MRASFERSKKSLFGRGGENLCPRGEFDEEALQDFKVELGVDVVQEKDGGLIETAPEKVEFGELQEEDDHLLFAPRQHLGGRPSVDRKLEHVALRPDERHAGTKLLATDPRKVVDDARLVGDRQIADVVAMLRDDRA